MKEEMTNAEVCKVLRLAHDALSISSRPPKREWVGLTKEDIAYLGIHTTDMYPDEFIKYVEARCKEKNT